jgi:hypothetical protein
MTCQNHRYYFYIKTKLKKNELLVLQAFRFLVFIMRFQNRDLAPPGIIGKFPGLKAENAAWLY